MLKFSPFYRLAWNTKFCQDAPNQGQGDLQVEFDPCRISNICIRNWRDMCYVESLQSAVTFDNGC